MTRDSRPIFDRFPQLYGRVPFHPLATLPTPVEPILGLWVKRDDRTHPELGGTKVRKLEFYLPRLKEPTIALGPRGSNWLVALQRFAPKTKIFTFPQHLNETAALEAARLEPTRHFPDPMLFAMGVLGEAPRILGDGLALAPAGGSSPETTLGYVNAALELAQQIRDRDCPKPDAIFVPLGSCGTAAGIAVGLGIAGLDIKLYAIRITSRLIANRRRLIAMAIQTAWLLDLKQLRLPRIEVVHDFCGPDYAWPTAEGRVWRRRFADTGIDLDLSYTSKAAAAWGAMKVPNALFWLTYARPR